MRSITRRIAKMEAQRQQRSAPPLVAFWDMDDATAAGRDPEGEIAAAMECFKQLYGRVPIMVVPTNGRETSQTVLHQLHAQAASRARARGVQ